MPFELIFELLLKLLTSLPQFAPELEDLIEGLSVNLDAIVLSLKRSKPLEEVSQTLARDACFLGLLGMEMLNHLLGYRVNVLIAALKLVDLDLSSPVKVSQLVRDCIELFSDLGVHALSSRIAIIASLHLLYKFLSLMDKRVLSQEINDRELFEVNVAIFIRVKDSLDEIEWIEVFDFEYLVDSVIHKVWVKLWHLGVWRSNL